MAGVPSLGAVLCEPARMRVHLLLRPGFVGEGKITSILGESSSKRGPLGCAHFGSVDQKGKQTLPLDDGHRNLKAPLIPSKHDWSPKY